MNNFKFFRSLFLSSLIITILGSSCKQRNDYEKVFSDSKLYAKTVKRLSDVMVDNIFSPTVASRNYAYSNIAAYEAMAGLNDGFQSLKGQIHDLDSIPVAEKSKKYNEGLSAIYAFCTVAEAVTFPEGSFKNYTDSIKNLAEEKGMPEEEIENSISFGKAVGKAIITWAKKDHYAQTRSAPKYSVRKEEGRWIPTPPGYMQAVEPSWNKIRTLVIDSADQFKPIPPPPFNVKDKNSAFYKYTLEVMNTGNNLSMEQQHIADFWDCNPYAIQMMGHVMIATKKISPGGHWMNICGIAAEKVKAKLPETIYTYALTSISIFDAFVSCWDEKYRSSVIRPETVINKYIDADWKPYLQTPPFPEYTSGHSVISTAAAVSLSKIYGDSFAFRDTSEVEFGIPERDFKSFIGASQEAAISRMYGGIHYMPAITVGQKQGREVGEYVISKLKLKK